MPANVESMAFTGEKPWHGLGTELENVFTSAEAIKAAKMDFTYELEEIKATSGALGEGRRAIVRHRAGSKPNMTGIASDKYVILQPKDAFSFFDGVVGQKLAMYHTAGVLGAGERIWILAKLPSELVVGKADKIEKFALLTTGYDGLTATVMTETPIRVVCQNTLNAALEGREQKLRIRHRGDIKAHLSEAQKLLKVALKYYDELGGAFQAMSGFTMKSAHVKKLLDACFPVADERKAETSRGNSGTRERILHLAEKGVGTDLPGVRGTAWGFYNAVTEFTDHFRKTKVAGVQDATDAQYQEARLTSQWFGLGRSLKDKAFNVLMDTVKKPRAAAEALVNS